MTFLLTYLLLGLVYTASSLISILTLGSTPAGIRRLPGCVLCRSAQFMLAGWLCAILQVQQSNFNSLSVVYLLFHPIFPFIIPQTNDLIFRLLLIHVQLAFVQACRDSWTNATCMTVVNSWLAFWQATNKRRLIDWLIGTYMYTGLLCGKQGVWPKPSKYTVYETFFTLYIIVVEQQHMVGDGQTELLSTTPLQPLASH